MNLLTKYALQQEQIYRKQAMMLMLMGDSSGSKQAKELAEYYHRVAQQQERSN